MGLVPATCYKEQVTGISPLVCADLNSFSIGTLRYKDGKARTATAVDAGNFRGSRGVAKNKMLKMCIFAKDGDVNNSNLVQAIHGSNDIH